MKNLNIYILLMAVLVVVACDPMKETIDDLDATPTTITADLEIVLDDDDYEMSGVPSAETFHSFSNVDDAKEGIPNILNEKYPQLGKPSSAKVVYDLYAPIRMSYDTAHTLTTADYDSIGEPYGSLSSLGDIFKATEYVVPDPGGNVVLELGYQWWTGSAEESRENTMANYNDKWYIAYVPTTEEYYAMGQSYPNFDSRTTARNELANMLNTNYYVSAKEGDYRTAVFTYTYEDNDEVRHFDNFLAVFILAGSKWNPIQDVGPAVMQLGHNGTTWVPDNTIKYTMTGDDYTFVATTYASVNAAGAASMNQYGNYDLTIWSDDEVTSSVADLLKENFPFQEDGQKYTVSYKVWTGSAGMDNFKSFIKSGDSYVPVTE